IGTDEQVEGSDNFGVAEREAKKNRVACRDIGDGNALADFLVGAVFGHRERVSQGRAADGAEINADYRVPDCSQCLGQLTGALLCPARWRGPQPTGSAHHATPSPREGAGVVALPGPPLTSPTARLVEKPAISG